ncbi:unnamed protein product [Calypogeia fissa]
MVLSHSKLKRKRKDESGAADVESGGAIREAPSSTPSSAPDAAGEVKKTKKKEKKHKRQKVDDGAGNGNGKVELTPSNGAVVAEEAEVPKEEIAVNDKKALKKEKKEEKKRRKAAEREAAAQNPPSDSKQNGDHPVEIRTDEAASNGGEMKAEQPVGENGTTAADSERPLSVREKKGKKKKGAKDRWGVKIDEEEPVEDTPVPTEAVREAPSTSTLASGGEMYDLRKVVVGGMPYYCTEDDIHDYFTECGEISELDCMTFPDTGKFRGIAFITFKTEEGAAKALEYDGEDMGGRFLKIEKCKIKPGAAAKDPERGEVQKTPGSTSAYIGNLSWDVTEDLIKNFFKKTYSNTKIDAIRLAFDKDSGDFKGFGHVDFGDDESLEAAVKMNQTPLLGRPMKVAYSVPPKSSVNGANGKSESRASGTCYNCGEEGHKAFLCPKKGANANEKFDSKKVAACYSCGEEGHKSFLCPKNKST